MQLFSTLTLGLAAVATPTAAFSNIHLNTHVAHRGPTSRVHSLLTNGSSIPAGGAVWPTAIYWTTVQVGTPAVDFPVCIDSGSGDLDISAVGCANCPTAAPNKKYDHTKSSTAKAVFPYVFSNSYQTCDLTNPTAVCTISGSIYSEQVSLAGYGPVTVKTGAITKQTSNFDQFKAIGGVMGFTSGGPENVFAQLVAGNKCDNVWAMCMYQGKKSNGTITIGGVDPLLSTDMTYVPDVGFSFHSVQVKSLTLGAGINASSASIQVNEAAILDTGTNILLAPTKVMKALQAAMCVDKTLTSCNAFWSNTCVAITEAQVDAYPDLTMNLDGVDLVMTSRDYLLKGSPVASSADQYCLGIRDGGSAGGTGFIIGDTTMRNYYLVFDLAGKKIGWGKVNKDNCGSI